MLRNFFAIFLFIFAFFVCAPVWVYADEDFDISTNASYIVSIDGNTHVSQTVSIKNKTEFTYAPSYTIGTGIKDIRNLKTADNNGILPAELKDVNDSGKSITINFDRRITGLGNTNTFTVSYDTSEIAKSVGNVWEVIIPGLSAPTAFTDYRVTLSVPQSFGPVAISKPHKNITGSGTFTFSRDEIGKSGVLITFGKEQYYKVNLKYGISNTKIYPVKTEIALPPETSYQEIRINEITPRPEDVYEDKEGNWLAVYELKPNEVKVIKAEVIARVFSKPTFTISDPKGYLSQAKYWEVNSPEIRELVKSYKTPQQIYDYVVSKLKYSLDKVGKSNERLGAAGSLAKPDFAVCLEFTDLFITLTRAAGIPSRAVEGYAYTDNSRLRPLSLVEDVLHAWPEYYDSNRRAWVMVDPTWGNTTSGMDYFNSLDFHHLAFAVKGESSTYPVPAGGYNVSGNTKDVEVSFAAESDFIDVSQSEVEAEFPKNVLSGFSIKGSITVKNTGNLPIRDKKLIIKSDLKPISQDFNLGEIPPYGSKVINLSFDRTPFLTNKNSQVRILFDGSEVTKNITVGILPDIFIIIVGGVIICGSFILAILTYKTWHIYFQRRAK